MSWDHILLVSSKERSYCRGRLEHLAVIRTHVTVGPSAQFCTVADCCDQYTREVFNQTYFMKHTSQLHTWLDESMIHHFLEVERHTGTVGIEWQLQANTGVGVSADWMTTWRIRHCKFKGLVAHLLPKVNLPKVNLCIRLQGNDERIIDSLSHVCS